MFLFLINFFDMKILKEKEQLFFLETFKFNNHTELFWFMEKQQNNQPHIRKWLCNIKPSHKITCKIQRQI